jgi:hypothetical protein
VKGTPTSGMPTRARAQQPEHRSRVVSHAQSRMQAPVATAPDARETVYQPAATDKHACKRRIRIRQAATSRAQPTTATGRTTKPQNTQLLPTPAVRLAHAGDALVAVPNRRPQSRYEASLCHRASQRNTSQQAGRLGVNRGCLGTSVRPCAHCPQPVRPIAQALTQTGSNSTAWLNHANCCAHTNKPTNKQAMCNA